MTVIRNNSISGINSITAQSSALNFYDSAGNDLTLAFGNGLNVTSGSVGIGTDNASAAKLDVRGSDNPLLKLTQTTSGIARLNIESETNDGYQYAGIGIGSATADTELMWTTLGFDVNVADSVRLRIPSSGDVQVLTGNLVIGTSGKGIDFSATSDAGGMTSELLDDYEEGTWTPSYSAAFTGSYASNGQIGRYTKVGRIVTAYFFIQVSSVSGSGGFALNGLPYATASATNYNPGAVISLAGNWSTNTPFSLDASGSGTTTYNIKYRSSANGSIDAGNIAVSDLATNAFMRAVIVYETA